MNIQLYLGDCLIEMNKIADKSVDMILADLPYGMSACKWDVVIPFEPLWEQYKRVIKDDGAIVLFGSEPFSSHLRLSSLKWYKYDWVWEKPNGANFLNFKYQPNKVHENIMVFSKMASSYSTKGNMKYFPQMDIGKPYFCIQGKLRDSGEASNFRGRKKQVETINNGTRFPRSIIAMNKDTNTMLHPTQKPVALLEYLIKTYTNEGDTVLDNVMGSGSTGVACVNTNRNFIGIEINEKYYQIAKERIMEVENVRITKQEI